MNSDEHAEHALKLLELALIHLNRADFKDAAARARLAINATIRKQKLVELEDRNRIHAGYFRRAIEDEDSVPKEGAL